MNEPDHTRPPRLGPKPTGIKRFWKTAAPAPAPGGGFAVTLDGRPAKTPQGARLVLPAEALAGVVVQEWSDVAATFDYSAMPLTRLAFTAIDRIAGARRAVAEEIARYAAADVLCYFAETPTALVERQVERWGPVLDWAKTDLGLKFVRASGIQHEAQPPKTVARVLGLALELDDFALAGLAWAAALFGSAILALALQRRELDGATAFDLSRLDEQFQIERWGEDEEAAERTDAMRTEAVRLQKWFESLA